MSLERENADALVAHIGFRNARLRMFSSAIMIRDFCNPFLLVEVRNCKLRVIGINKKKKETFVVSPKVQTSGGRLAGYEHVGYETKIETPLIFCIEINGNRLDRVLYYICKSTLYWQNQDMSRLTS